jgi:putative hydrolase of the HAD superfamily
MQTPEAILFDLWGTLITADSFDPVRGNEAVLRCCDNPRGAALGEILRLADRVVTSLQAREEQAALEFTQPALLRIVADSFALRFRKGMDEIEWDFWCASMSVRLIDGVRVLLAEVERRGIRMGVISNSSFTGTTLERELARQGIRSHFELVISSADYGVRKPDPIIFETALRRLGLEARQAWFVGDDVRCDVAGADAAGLFPVAFQPRQAIPAGIPEHAVITRWSELLPLAASTRPAVRSSPADPAS